jgi:hypothetical protein
MRDAVKSMQPGGHETDDLSWDAVWEVATTVDDEGWTAEYRIPFSQLRFRKGEEHHWGIQLERVIGRNREYAVSSFTPKNERGGIPTFGHLEGIRGVDQGQPVELLPYAVTRSEHVNPGDNPFRTNSEQAASGGLDLLFRATSNLTLNATFNPDFGQVEVDPAVVNLGVYETFFQEKRPFFVEGSEIFQFGRGTSGGRLFYSRRIGRPPQTRPETTEADVPTETTILGAAKLSGKTAGGWSIGTLTAVTGEETARYLTAEGVVESMVAEPRTGYFIGRVRKEMRAGLSSMGGMVTTTLRDLTTPTLQDKLRSAAYSGGIDFNHEFAGRTWVIRGNLLGSRVEGSPAAMVRVQQASNHYLQRPDADYLEVDHQATSLSGYSASIALDKQAGRHWLGGIAGAITSPGYEINDLGFAMRTDRRDLQGTFTYRETQPGSFFRDWSVSGRLRNEMNFDAQTILRMAGLSYQFRHLSFWGANLNVRRMFRSNDDRATRGGPMIVRPANTSVGADVFTDGRKAVALQGGGDVEWDEFDGYRYGAGVDVTLRLSSRWNLTVAPGFFRTRIPAQYLTTVDDPQYTATYGKGYIFAELNQTEIGVETRFNFTFRPGLTLETYIQPLVSAGDYGEPQYLEAPGTFDFAPYSGLGYDPDFNIRSLRGNAVLRWEWRPGSNLYLAWQQRRFNHAAFGDFRFTRDMRAVFETPADNIFLIKVSYWLSP